MSESSPLVEPEGVNAGSAAQSENHDSAENRDSAQNNDAQDGGGSPLGGGDPSGAPDSAMETDLDPSDEEGDEMVGTTEISEGGQDQGSLE